MQDRVDIVTGTLGKALGGASGGYTAAHAEIVEMLRQRSRPYLFSNSLPPSIAAAGDRHAGPAGDLGRAAGPAAGQHRLLPGRDAARGFEIPESDHPIVPVMIGDAAEAGAMADRLLAEGIYVRAFSFPVVPRGQARIRTQMSAAHSRDDLDRAIAAFVALAARTPPIRDRRAPSEGRLSGFGCSGHFGPGTICLPSGIRLIGISLKLAMPIGMPMIVRHSAAR